jgi:hypothetical protein
LNVDRGDTAWNKISETNPYTDRESQDIEYILVKARGQILETSPNTAASRYQYAIAKLTKRLSPQYREVHRD